MPIHCQLRDIATVHMGYTYRGSLKNATSGNTAVIQMGNASPEGILQTEQFARTQIDYFPAHYLLGAGDLIFRSRGNNNTAILIEQPLERTICIAPLMFIRIRSQQQVLPAYLQWFIQLPCTQLQIDDFAHGENIRMISAQSMEDLNVVVPALDKQHKIAVAAKLDHEISITASKLAATQRRYANEALLQFAKGTLPPPKPPAKHPQFSSAPPAKQAKNRPQTPSTA